MIITEQTEEPTDLPIMTLPDGKLKITSVINMENVNKLNIITEAESNIKHNKDKITEIHVHSLWMP